MSAMDSMVEGTRLPDGRFRVDITVGGATRQETMDWAAGALLADGQRLAMLDASRQPGRHFRLRMFDPASRQVLDVDTEVLGEETVQLPGGAERLSHQHQVLHQARGEQVLDLWLDAQGRVRKGCSVCWAAAWKCWPATAPARRRRHRAWTCSARR
jgi:hypothetical protein